MPRGGRRPGAGRKPGKTLSFMRRMRIGAMCERQWQAGLQVAQRAAIVSSTKEQQIDWEKARRIPIEQRRQWLRSQAADPDGYFEDLWIARRIDQGIDPKDPREPDRVVNLTADSQEGIRDEIIGLVAEHTGLTPWMVRQCWAEFIEVGTRMDEESENPNNS